MKQITYCTTMLTFCVTGKPLNPFQFQLFAVLLHFNNYHIILTTSHFILCLPTFWPLILPINVSFKTISCLPFLLLFALSISLTTVWCILPSIKIYLKSLQFRSLLTGWPTCKLLPYSYLLLFGQSSIPLMYHLNTTSSYLAAPY